MFRKCEDPCHVVDDESPTDACAGTPLLVEKSSAERKRWRFVLKLSLTVCLVGMVLSIVNFQEVMDALANLNQWYLLGFILLIYLDRALMSYKWNRLLRAVDVEVSFSTVFHAYSIAPLAGILLPASVGGDLFRLYDLARLKADARAVFASIIVERVIGVVALLAVALVGLGLAFFLVRDSVAELAGLGWVILLGFTIAVCVGGVIYNSFGKYAGKFADLFRSHPIFTKVYHVYIFCCEYRNHLRTMAVVFAWTLLEQIAPIIGNFLMVRALHIDVSLLQLAAIIPLILLAVRLPISLSGLGVNEGLYVALFGLVGVTASQAVLLSVLVRALTLLSATPWGVHYIITVWKRSGREQDTCSVKL